MACTCLTDVNLKQANLAFGQLRDLKAKALYKIDNRFLETLPRKEALGVGQDFEHCRTAQLSHR